MIQKFGEETLLTPGPINVPQRVLEASARPLLHHRTPQFAAKMRLLLDGMKQVFQTRNDILLVHGTGRSGVEGTISNLFSAGEEVLSVCNGRFGLLYSEIAAKFGLKVTRVATDWSRDVDLDEVRAALRDNPNLKAITVCQCETSTGVINDIPGLGKVAREFDKLLLVDCVSSAAGVELRFDEWGVDAATTGAQKGLMSPPGLAFVVLSERAWEATETAALPHYYIDFKEIRKGARMAVPSTPGTTPVTLVAAAAEAMAMILEEGLPNVCERYEKVSRAVKAGFVASGLRLFPETCNRRSPTVTVFEVPKGFEAAAFVRTMNEEFGLIPATGLGPYSKSLIRIGHMGSFYQREAITTVAAVEASLVKMGVNAESGPGVKACVQALFE